MDDAVNVERLIEEAGHLRTLVIGASPDRANQPVPIMLSRLADALALAAPLLEAGYAYREALRSILFLRPGGPCRNKLVEQMEIIARDALEATPLPPRDGGQAVG